MIPVPDDSVEVDLGAGYARFRLTTSIWDDHDVKSSLTRVLPAGFPQVAEVTFDVEWSGIIDRAHVTSEATLRLDPTDPFCWGIPVE